jgi:hypothetical protein
LVHEIQALMHAGDSNRLTDRILKNAQLTALAAIQNGETVMAMYMEDTSQHRAGRLALTRGQETLQFLSDDDDGSDPTT